MTRDAIGRNGRTGKNKLSRGRTIIHRTTNIIPYFWLLLPFVDQTRCGALKHGGRINGNHAACISINIQQYFTLRYIPRGSRLPASLGAFYNDGSRSLKSLN